MLPTRVSLLAKRCATALTMLMMLALATGTQPARADKTVVVVGGMTGAQSAYGIAIVNGVDLAIADINAKGGLLGQRLQSQLVDDACDPAQAEVAARQAISLQPSLVVGHYCSSACSIIAAPIYAQAKVIQIAPTSTNPRLTEMGLNTVFRMIGRDDAQGRAAADRIAATWPHGKVAVLDDGNLYGKGLTDIVRAQLHKRGIPIALDGQYQPGAPTYAGLVHKLAEASVQAVFLGGYILDTSLIAREAAQAHLRLTILSGDAMIEPNFWRIAGKAGESAIFTFSPDPLDGPAGQALYKSARERGIDLSGKAALAYAAVEAWAAAVAQTGSFETGKVASALHTGRFETAIGPIWFDHKGDIQGKLGEWTWYRWRDGKPEHAPDPERP